MKTCINCGQPFDAQISSDSSFIEELGEYYLEGTNQNWEDDLCPICLEEMGMMNLMGFDTDDL